jgi:hypothetical protein
VSAKNVYRYKRFTTKLLLNDMRFSKSAPMSGDDFPDFELPTTDGHQIRNPTSLESARSS